MGMSVVLGGAYALVEAGSGVFSLALDSGPAVGSLSVVADGRRAFGVATDSHPPAGSCPVATLDSRVPRDAVSLTACRGAASCSMWAGTLGHIAGDSAVTAS